MVGGATPRWAAAVTAVSVCVDNRSSTELSSSPSSSPPPAPPRSRLLSLASPRDPPSPTPPRSLPLLLPALVVAAVSSSLFLPLRARPFAAERTGCWMGSCKMRLTGSSNVREGARERARGAGGGGVCLFVSVPDWQHQLKQGRSRIAKSDKKKGTPLICSWTVGREQERKKTDLESLLAPTRAMVATVIGSSICRLVAPPLRNTRARAPQVNEPWQQFPLMFYAELQSTCYLSPEAASYISHLTLLPRAKRQLPAGIIASSLPPPTRGIPPVRDVVVEGDVAGARGGLRSGADTRRLKAVEKCVSEKRVIMTRTA